MRHASLAEIAAVYPRAASAKGLSGSVLMACTVHPDGLLGPCDIVSEDPLGNGFGQAALKLAPLFRVDVASLGPMPAGFWTVQVRIRFAPGPAFLRC